MAELRCIDLVELVAERMALAAQVAAPRGIEIELNALDACPLPLHLESVTALVDNLIDHLTTSSAKMRSAPESGA